MRKLIVSMFAAVIVLVMPAAIFADESISLTIDGAVQSFDVSLRLIDDRLMLPLRAVLEALDSSVEWDEDTQSIIAATHVGDVVVFTVDEYTVSVNDTILSIEVPPMVVDGTMMVQSGVLALAMNLQMEWDAESRTLAVETPLLSIDTEEFERAIFDLTNEAREQRGLSPLTWDDGLADAARAHSQDMAENGLTGNTGSDGSTMLDRAEYAGIEMVHVAGNAFRVNLNTPEEVFELLINNRQRENNVIGEFAGYGGVGIAFVPRDRETGHLFIVQKFGAAVITDTMEFADRLFKLINDERSSSGARALRWDEDLANSARRNTRLRAEENSTRSRARDLVLERNLMIRHNEVSPEFLMRTIVRHDSRGMLVDRDYTRIGIGYVANDNDPNDDRVSIQLTIVFATADEIPEIADPFYIPNMIDAGYSVAEIAEKFEREVFRLTNIERSNNGLRTLIWDDALARGARLHSRDLAENNLSGSAGSDGSSPAERAQRTGTRLTFADENISNRFSSPRGAVDRWMSSSSHRNRILRADSSHLGVGFFILDDSAILTQVFARAQ